MQTVVLVRKLRRSSVKGNAGRRTTESRILHRREFSALEPRLYRSLKVWTGLKMRLRRNKRDARIFGIVLSPHGKREMKYIIRKSWSGCMWKKIQPASADTGGGMGTGETTFHT